MKSITIYTTSYCPYCKKAKALLSSLSIPFEEVDVEHNMELRAQLSEKFQWKTVPMIVIDEKFIGGCDDLFRLHERGELMNMVQ